MEPPTSKNKKQARFPGAKRPAEEPEFLDVPKPEFDVSIILLAAGNSSRMGQSKQLLPVHDEPLLLISVNTAVASGAKEVIVVLGANENAHREIIKDLPVTIVANHYWKTGMGSSIKTGMNALLKKSPETGAVIIMVCDQPALTPLHLKRLIKEGKGLTKPIVASAYADTVGVPALFARPFFSNILMLRDDQGAKKIIQQFAGQMSTIDFPDGSIDLDTAEDYQNFINSK